MKLACRGRFVALDAARQAPPSFVVSALQVTEHVGQRANLLVGRGGMQGIEFRSSRERGQPHARPPLRYSSGRKLSRRR